MRISVLIPTLNEGAGIGQAVEKALALGDRVELAEVVVSDGGSQDDTVACAEKAGAMVVNSPAGRGLQLQKGSEFCQGEVLLMLHADCWLAPEGAEQVIQVLENPSIGAGAFSQVIEADGLLYRALEWGNGFRANRLRMPYGDQGIFLRKSLLDQIGGIPTLPIMEDVELVRRLRRCTRFRLLPGPIHVSARRWQRRGIVRQTFSNWSLLAAYFAGVSAERLAGNYEPEPIKGQQAFEAEQKQVEC